MLWIGSFDHPTIGYTQAGLNYLMALLSAGHTDIDLLPLAAFRWDEMPVWARPLAAHRAGTTRSPCIIHAPPSTILGIQLSGRPRVGFTVFETDRIPYWNAKGLDETTDAMLVASQFNAEGLRAAGYTKPIHVVPHTVGPWWWERKHEKADPNTFLFTYIGTWHMRKNPMDVVMAYCAAFPTPVDGRALALKLSGTQGLEGRLNELTKGREDIWIWNESWSETRIQWLHNQTDVFVTAHRGEGWGMGPFQAKLLGRRVIYTNWSAVTEFCTPEDGDLPIDYTLEATPRGLDNLPYFDDPEGDLLWAKPNFDSLVEAMRTAYAERRPPSEEVALKMQAKYGWQTVGKQLSEVVKSLAL